MHCTSSRKESLKPCKACAQQIFLIGCLQACTEASYLEFRKEQLSLRAEAKALTEPKDASTHTSIESADWAASLRSSAPATTTDVPQPKEAVPAGGTVSIPHLNKLSETTRALRQAKYTLLHFLCRHMHLNKT